MAGTAAAPANAEIRIGASLPLSGDFELLGRQALDAMKVAAANFSGDTVTIVEADDACETQGGQDAAVALQEAAVEIVIGYICTEAADGGLPALKEDALTALVIGARTASLTETAEKNGWKLLRIAPAARHEREAVGAILSRQWRDVPFAIIDDGTLYGRELAEGLRFAAEENGLKPVFVDTFRPQLDNQVALVRRLQKAGATHVFIGGDAADAAVIGADAARLGVPLTLAGGDTFRASPLDVELPEGTLMVSTPDWATTLQANDAA
ncbi:MAG TPA: ABC transporter substrate-binding protein, partial [Rhizobiaceae bacterium]|nr:ABC transporter substrate-binding protein [Rhizobiaceae bacterium]